MKRMNIFFTLICFTLLATAQSEPYMEELGKALSGLSNAEDASDMQEVANKLERIFHVASQDWIPAYHTAYTYVVMNFHMEDGDKREAILDKAQSWLETSWANIPEGNEIALSEIHALQSYIYLGRVAIKPMVRGMSYGSKIQEEVDAALRLNSVNPRPDYVIGMYYQGMPSMFGGGKKAACPYFKRSAKLFEKFNPASSLAPNWGKERVEQLINECE